MRFVPSGKCLPGEALMDTTFSDILLALVFTAIAIAYASVGQAGATGYIAVMAIAGLGPEVIKPTALALNIVVAAIGTIRFAAAGLLTWRTCYPFAILGVPFSLLGGALNLPGIVYLPVVGFLLLLAAWQMIRPMRAASLPESALVDPPFLPSLATGGIIGFISGITGIGGGIFIAPLIISLAWATTRQAAAISANFNLLNSAAALAGAWATLPGLSPQLPLWMLAAAIGGLVGSWLALNRLPPTMLRMILFALLAVAGLRMLWTWARLMW
jgi:uncharacterized membrane protein YfcA